MSETPINMYERQDATELTAGASLDFQTANERLDSYDVAHARRLAQEAIASTPEKPLDQQFLEYITGATSGIAECRRSELRQNDFELAA